MLRVDPQVLGTGIPDEQVEKIVRAMQNYALLASKYSPAGAFCLLITAVGEFVEQTDAPIDLLSMAIDQLLEQRSELIARGVKATLVLKPTHAAPEAS